VVNYAQKYHKECVKLAKKWLKDAERLARKLDLEDFELTDIASDVFRELKKLERD